MRIYTPQHNNFCYIQENIETFCDSSNIRKKWSKFTAVINTTLRLYGWVVLRWDGWFCCGATSRPFTMVEEILQRSYSHNLTEIHLVK